MFKSLKFVSHRRLLGLLVALLALSQPAAARDAFPVDTEQMALPTGYSLVTVDAWEEFKRKKLGEDYEPEPASAPEPATTRAAKIKASAQNTSAAPTISPGSAVKPASRSAAASAA